MSQFVGKYVSSVLCFKKYYNIYIYIPSSTETREKEGSQDNPGFRFQNPGSAFQRFFTIGLLAQLRSSSPANVLQAVLP